MRTTRDAHNLAEALQIWDSTRDVRSKAGEGLRCHRTKANGHKIERVCTTRPAILDFYPVVTSEGS